MACNCYQTYPGHSGCQNGGCGSCGCNGGSSRWDNNIYFPDFVANSCCNPICDPCDDDNNEGCNICNGGGYGNGCNGCNGCSGQDGCGNSPSCPWNGCGCGRCNGCGCRHCPWYCGCHCNGNGGSCGGCGSCGSCGCHSGDIEPR